MREKIKNYLTNLSRNNKTAILIISDILTFNYIFLFSNFLDYFFDNFESNFLVFSKFNDLTLIQIVITNLAACLFIFSLNGYKSFFRSSNISNLIGSARWVGIFIFSSLVFLFSFLNKQSFFESFQTAIMAIFVVFFGLVIVRMIAYEFLSSKTAQLSKPIVIYGAGQAGRETAAYLSQNSEFNILGFIDDNRKLKNFNILGFKVFGGRKKLKKIKETHTNLTVIMAIINLSPKERLKIISFLESFEIHVKTIPYNYGALETKLSIQDVSLNDLLEREVSRPDPNLLKQNITNRSVLITGAGGSIGSEIAKQVANLNPSNIIFLDSSEYNLFQLQQEFVSFKNFKKMHFLLRDLRNHEELEKIFHKYEIDTIYHSAAYKHVPLLQQKENFISAIENNFFCTFNLCSLAKKFNISNLVLISSDKAVNPPNIMGASKRLSELALQAFSREKNNNTIFTIVRFGNVINSSGSVIPLFWKQIESGGPITVTHEEVNRFFMSIEEAASLVIQAGAISKGGEVFLLDMGKPIKIKELAEKMIRLSGNSVANSENENGIRIIYSGLRPGEKLNEELLLSNNPQSTNHPMIKKGIEKSYNLKDLIFLKDELLNNLVSGDINSSLKSISNFVDGFKYH